MSVKINRSSLRLTIVALGNAQVSMARATEAAVLAAGQAYRDAVRANVSLRDHTLSDLARLGHPYARRHGRIRLHAGDDAGGTIVDGTSLVHTQSGAMVRALRGRLTRGGASASYEVDFDAAAAPHVDFVLGGTRKMLPRDPLWHTAIAPKTIERMRFAVVRALGAELRSQALVRFG